MTEEAPRTGATTDASVAALLQHLPGMVYRCRIDSHWTMLYVSEGAAALTGYRPDELIQNREIAFGSVIHPDDRERVWLTVQGYLASEYPYELEYRIVTRCGDVRWICDRGRRISAAADEPLLEGFLSDCSERKAVEDERKRLYTAIQQSPSAVIITNAEGLIQYVNPAFEESTGYSAAEAVGRNPRFLQSRKHTREFYERLWRTISSGHTWSGYMINRRKDGTLYHEYSVIGPVLAADGTIESFVSSKQDVTHELALEAKLRQQQKLEAIGTLAGGVAHEINNPLNGILNYAQLIRDAPAEASTAEYAAEIMRETERVAGIVRNLLTFARQDAQAQSPARMSDIVAATVSLIQSIMRKEQIRLAIDVPAELPPFRCRSQQIQQVIMNLVTNARDALNERYPGHDPDKAIDISARQHAMDGRPCIRLSVRDQGTGIDPEVRDRIFDPFFTTKPKGVGTGLGMSITHGIVCEHGGAIAIESELGAYTCVHVDMPLDNERNV